MQIFRALLLMPLLFAPATSFASDQYCWDVVRKFSPKISADFACVSDKAGTSLKELCSADGAELTAEFNRYAIYRLKFNVIKAEADRWLAEHPGSTELPVPLSGRLQNAENAWKLLGMREEMNGAMERVRLQSVDCE